MTERQNNPLNQFADVKRWVNWKLETKDGKPTKVPYQPGGALASTTDPATWSTFAGLHRNGFSGPGIVFTPDRLLLGVDGDHILDGAFNITDYRFRKFVTAADTYTEYSQSGTGLHVFLALTEPLDLDANKKKFKDGRGYECYTVGRYFTVTFKPFTDKPIRRVTPSEAIKLLELLGYPWPKHLADDKLLERMFAARNGSKAHALYEGDIGDYGNDDSGADMAFCNMLAWWTNQDTAQMERIWLASKLGERDKVQDRKDYRDRTIQAALDEVKGGYDPNADRVVEDELKQTTGMNAAPILPDIRANGRELRDVSQDAMQALAVTGDIFVRGGALVRVKVDELGHASIEETSESALRGMLARCADFYRERTDKDGENIRTTIAPPLEVVRDVLSLGAWDFPPIESVIESPTMRPDGTILCTPGYDPATRLFYHPAAGFVMPDIPANPSQKDIDTARDLLYDVISDFPFVNDASRDNAIGTTVTLATRAMVDGPVPIPVFDAPQQGTGKTLLAAIAASMATGEAPIAGAAPNDPEEWRKRITTELGTGKRVIVLDNVTGVLNDPSLSAVSTARLWGDRRLGTNSEPTLPARAVWMITGNNIRVGGDLVRRCYSIRLDAKISRPWQREGFKYADIEGHVRANRGALIGAALTLARAWVVAGRPRPSGIRMGGFEGWAQVVGGIMQHAGATYFLDNLTEFYENADDDTPAWESFIGKLHELFGDAETTCGQVFTRFCPDPDHAATEDLSQYVPQELAGLLDLKSKAKFVQRLGYAFKERKGKRHGDTQARVEQGKGTKNTTWKFYVSAEGE